MSRRCALTGKGVQSGNNVSHAKNRNRRRFLPNLQRYSLHSEVLGHIVRLRLCTGAMRSVDSRGGIDSYLLTARNKDLTEDARSLRKRIVKAKIKKQASA